MAKWAFSSLLGAYLVAVSLALPSSLVQEIKNSEMKSNKVKRAQSDSNEPEENIGKMSYFTNRPTSAIKRGTNLKEADMGEWNRDQLYGGRDFSLDNIQSGLYDFPNLPMDDKTIAEYEKGYQYGTNKEKLDAALQNAILKSELYGDNYGPSIWPYEDRRRRKRETVSNKRNTLRYKRNVDLTPDEVLRLLQFYEKNQRELKNGEFYPVEDNNDETWFNEPMRYGSVDRPANNRFHQINSQPDYKPRWGAFDPATFKKKRLFY
ncbi:uncharacterized protein LOC109537854 isoform X1 [Dendroctonus ponderosae]|uniref:Uncharacterized protein n=1 Tax=Dendroctonus ponderosae TaxID=77166 RepID=A0AAR5PHI8_DENPD|nr:uncharacterized protein LOC109537854 isoform X1 [Dendroctonus ponderosae]KAH1025318.1 hypothetical protein HUJ05_010063 [Dendroctonus ponderosae]